MENEEYTAKTEQYSININVDDKWIKAIDFYNVDGFIVGGEAFTKWIAEELGKLLERQGMEGIDVVKVLK